MKHNIPKGVTPEMSALLTAGARNDSDPAVTLACRGYCEYYNEDENGDGCNGLAAVRKGMITGKIGLAQISHLFDLPPGPARRSGCLINEMCFRCSYLEGGCDFMSTSPPPDATPCGGYRLIQALLDHGALTPAVVRVMVQNKVVE